MYIVNKEITTFQNRFKQFKICEDIFNFFI